MNKVKIKPGAYIIIEYKETGRIKSFDQIKEVKRTYYITESGLKFWHNGQPYRFFDGVIGYYRARVCDSDQEIFVRKFLNNN